MTSFLTYSLRTLTLLAVVLVAFPAHAGTAFETLNPNTQCSGSPVGSAWTQTLNMRGPETSQESRYFEIPLAPPAGFATNPSAYCFQVKTQDTSPGGGQNSSIATLNYTITAQWYSGGTKTSRPYVASVRRYSYGNPTPAQPTMLTWGSTSGTVTFVLNAQDYIETAGAVCSDNSGTPSFGSQLGATNSWVWWVGTWDGFDLGDGNTIYGNGPDDGRQGYEGYPGNGYEEFIRRCLSSGYAYCMFEYNENLRILPQDSNYYEFGNMPGVTPVAMRPRYNGTPPATSRTDYGSVERTDSRVCTPPSRSLADTCVNAAADQTWQGGTQYSIFTVSANGSQGTLNENLYSCQTQCTASGASQCNFTASPTTYSCVYLPSSDGVLTAMTPGSTTYYVINPGPSACDVPTACADIEKDIGSWYNGGTQTTLWLETGENASNGGGLNNNNFWLNQCVADCEVSGYDKCNFRFVNDLGETQASQTSYRCSAVTGSAILEPKAITTVGDIETQYTAITVPNSCTVSSCTLPGSVPSVTPQRAENSWFIGGTSSAALTSIDESCLATCYGAGHTYCNEMSVYHASGEPYTDYSCYGVSNPTGIESRPVQESPVQLTTRTWSANSNSCTVANGINLTAGAVTPTTATAGVSVTLQATVTNNGALATGAGFTNLFQLDSDADHSSVMSSFTDTSPALAVSGTDVTTLARTLTAGTWYVRVCADNNASMVGAITESNEGDNCGPWTPITVSGGGGVTSCSVSPTSITAGGSATWTALPTGLISYTFTPSETGTGVVRPSNTYSRTYASAGTYGMSVTAGGSTVACSNTVTVGAVPCGTATPTITAVPDRVTTGGTSVLTVSASGVDGTCTVTGPGVNQTLTASSCGVPSTTINTPALTGQSTYTISCDGGEATAKSVINVSTKWTIF